MAQVGGRVAEQCHERSGCRATVRGTLVGVGAPRRQRKQTQFRPQSSASPTAAGARRGSRALLSLRAVSVKMAWLHSLWEAMDGKGHPPSFLTKSKLLQRDPHPPHVEALGPRVAACHMWVTSLLGLSHSTHPILTEGGARMTPVSLSVACSVWLAKESHR